MKHNFKSFLAGAVTTALIGSLTFTALAATGAISLQVTPVTVMVNNQEFKPKDAQGNEVMVFTSNGTTYAPLRSLAEAYGLQVGWDQQKQMATVGKSDSTTPSKPDVPNTPTDQNHVPDNTAYKNFVAMWSITRTSVTQSNEILCDAIYSGNLNKEKFIELWNSISKENKEDFAKQLAKEYQLKNPSYILALYFSYSGTKLGYAFAYEDNHALSSFVPNPFNIHNISD